MKSCLVVLTGLLVLPLVAHAQAGPADSALVTSNNPEKFVASAQPGDSFVGSSSATAAVVTPATAATDAATGSRPASTAVPQDRQGAGPDQSSGVVYADPKIGGDWEAFGGYTFTRFYEVSGTTVTGNGYNFGLNFYPKGTWIGGDGEFMTTFGTLKGQSSRLTLGMGGVKLRWAMDNGVELWGHGLGGTAHFAPQTQYGNQGSVAYEVGVGADFCGRYQHWSLRVEGDMLGTRFFNLTQYSPKVSAAIVFKF